MKDRKQNEKWIIACTFFAYGAILFFNLWARSLENHGYLRYAEVAREMMRSGDWVVPRLNGEVFIDKPPLLFWLIALPSSLFGSVTPLIARLPSFFSAWAGILILYLWGKKVYGTTQSGLIAGGILLSCYQYFTQARLAKTDILLCLFILLSLYFFYLGYEELRRRRYLLYSLAFFFMGLGVLTKGPFGLLPPFIIISAFLIKEGRWRVLVSREFFLGYFILVLTVLPWILLFIDRIGFEQTMTLVRGNQILTRKAPIYFYFLEIWAQFSPWSLLLPFLFVYLWRRRGEAWHSGESFFLIWFVVFFLILTLFKFRASRYLLPAVPPLALMMGGMWKKRLVYFVAVLLLTIFIWHGREFYWVKKNDLYSPGLVLVRELGPFVKGPELFGYRLDRDTLVEINFYLDPIKPVSVLKEIEDVSGVLRGEKGKWVLMPKEAYHEVYPKMNPEIVYSKAFRYKRESLVLITSSSPVYERKAIWLN